MMRKPLHEEYQQTSSDSAEYICLTCYKDLHEKNPKLPAQVVANGLQLTPIPEEFSSLNDLEQWFIISAYLFMKLVALPKGKQCSIIGPHMNVPAKTNAVTDFLPQMPEEVQLVHFKLNTYWSTRDIIHL